ncbi:hypothetical protein SISNIDRAFT_413800 [Sistotremastrum niveocremeum HHB9708]|uniref:beta-glucosidase n=1 Tax=Sistotremastrum niveocremeum HHB9708 TaxID=1314777 RepID=A0A164SKF8_9AGAM|nr:hypothetical protein SISNIDRAFT_413800 [Sistotremastrum niveocremeum HHB9708]
MPRQRQFIARGISLILISTFLYSTSFISFPSTLFPSSDVISSTLNHALERRQSPGSPTGTALSTGPTSPLILPSPNVTATGPWSKSILRAKQFTSGLTLPEKINLTTGIDVNGRCVGNSGSIPRLNFAGFCLEDSPLGVRLTDYNSAFPAGINAAMSWDKDLILQRGQAMGAEHRGKGVNVQLGPMMNLGRDAAAGRNWEGFGADPFLAGVASALTIQGIQSQGVIACAKHYIGNEQEHFRSGSGGGENSVSYSSDIDDRTLHEVYAWPFAESIKAGVGSVMCAYNRINGTYACENSKIINGIAKEELDFKGFLLSDWAALESGAASALAGTDMNQPGFIGYGIGPQNEPNPSTANNSFWGEALAQMVANGTVPEWRVDDMVVRIMSAYYEMGQDKDYPAVKYWNFCSFNQLGPTQPGNEHVNVQGNHSILIREIGAKSTVLLKNLNGTLPLNEKKLPRNIAIFGSDAGPNPDGPNGCGDRGCDQGTLAMGWGSGTANFPYLIDPLSAIANWVHENSPDTMIEYVTNDYNYNQVTSLATQADLCMVFANADSGEGYITVDGNAGDRNNLTLWHSGDTLITTASSHCPNTIVVLHTVGPVILEKWIESENVTAVLFAGLPGQESGNSIVDVLSGSVNPSARLPFTIAESAFDYSANVVYSNPTNEIIIHIPYDEALEIDYRHFDANGIVPRFEFGFGLSYTSSATNSSTILSSSLPPTPTSAPVNASLSISGTGPAVTPTGGIGGPTSLYDTAFTISFTIHNTGAFDGDEVAQVYVGFPDGSGEPPKVLRGFEKVWVGKGARCNVQIVLRNKDISIWDVVKQAWVIPSGRFTFFVGASSRDIRMSQSVTVTKLVTLNGP